MAEEYQQTIATAQGDGKVVGVDAVDLKGKEDDQKFHDEIIGYEKVDVQDVQAMTKVGEGEKLGCDTSSSDSKSSSDSDSDSDSKSDSASSKSNSVSSKSNSDSNSKSSSNSGTEKKRIKRRVQKVKLSKKLAEKGEEKIGMVTEMDVNKDGVEGTKLLEEGDDKLHDKLQCDSSDSGSKSGSDSNSKSGSDSGSKSGSSTINTKAKRSIRKGLKEKIKEQTSMKIVKEDKKNDPLISLEANKSDDKETKMVEEGDENKQKSMLECDSSDSGSKSGSDSGSKSGSDSASKFGSEKERNRKLRRKSLKDSKKLIGMREEENKIGLVAALEFNEDKTQEVGEGAMDKKINLLNKPLSDSSDAGFKSDSDIGLGVDMAVIVEKLEEPMKMEGSLEEKKSFLKKLQEKLPSYHKKPI